MGAYVGGNDGFVRAIDVATGALRWETGTARVLGSPAVTDVLVVVCTSDGLLYRIERETGSVEFSLAAGDRIYPSPAVVDNWIYLGSHDGSI